MKMQCDWLSKAFEIGSDICDTTTAGYHFIVHLVSGTQLTGTPEMWDGETYLAMDIVGGMKNKLIPLAHIAAIEVIEV